MDNLDQLMAGMQGEVDQYVQDVRAGGEAIEGRPNQFFSDGFGDNPTFTVQP